MLFDRWVDIVCVPPLQNIFGQFGAGIFLHFAALAYLGLFLVLLEYACIHCVRVGLFLLGLYLFWLPVLVTFS